MDMDEMAKSEVLNSLIKKKEVLNSSFCFSRPSLLCIAVLIPSLGFICFLSFEFFPLLLTISILILSTMFVLTNTNKKVIFDEKPVGNLLCGQENLLHDGEGVREQLVQEVEDQNEVGHELLPTMETVTQTAQQSENVTNYDYQVEHFDVPSESDEQSVPSENFELNWMCSNNLGPKAEISDGCSVSDDDDSLIEINLPASEPKEKLQSNLPDSFFRQQGLREHLADINEVNEEDNLIEIDISMGSIKCPGFEIDA
ncbi:hypothetical protein ACE6H2_015185 [Prunus campanulata]